MLFNCVDSQDLFVSYIKKEIKVTLVHPLDRDFEVGAWVPECVRNIHAYTCIYTQ